MFYFFIAAGFNIFFDLLLTGLFLLENKGSIKLPNWLSIHKARIKSQRDPFFFIFCTFFMMSICGFNLYNSSMDFALMSGVVSLLLCIKVVVILLINRADAWNKNASLDHSY